MEIKKYYNFDDLQNECWSGAEDTLDKIYSYDLEDEFMDWLEGYFEDIPTLTEVNDLLRFDSEFVFECIGLNEEEDEEEEEEEDEDE